MRRLALVLLALVLLALLAAPATADAGQRQESVFQDDNLLLYRGDAVSDRTFDELRDLGVDRVRLSVPWRALAPSPKADRKPAPLRYRAADFHPWDHALRAARARDMDVLLNVTGGAPIWATGRRDGKRVSRQYKPSPREFEAFVRVLGERYDGRHGHPRVEAWSIWNEPNYGAFLQPQYENGRPASPAIYRGLARAMLRGLRATGHGDDVVLLGETSPRGVDARGTTTPMAPGLFLRELLCLDASLIARPGCGFDRRMEVTGYGHHPYPITDPPDVPSVAPDDISLADRARLTAILDAAAGAGRVPPELPLWYTEMGWQTPPDPVRGVPLARHARWLAHAEYLTRSDDRVAALTQFQLRDDPPRRGEYAPSSPRYWGTYQAGLRFADGRRKPGYAAYRLPLYAPERVPPGQRLRLWGLVRPPKGDETPTVQLEHRAPGARSYTKVLEPLRVVDPSGQFEFEPPQRSGTWRYVWRGLASNAVAVTVE